MGGDVGDVRGKDDILYQECTYVSRRGRESRGIVSPFSSTSVCNLVCVFMLYLKEIYAYICSIAPLSYIASLLAFS